MKDKSWIRWQNALEILRRLGRWIKEMDLAKIFPGQLDVKTRVQSNSSTISYIISIDHAAGDGLSVLGPQIFQRHSVCGSRAQAMHQKAGRAFVRAADKLENATAA